MVQRFSAHQGVVRIATTPWGRVLLYVSLMSLLNTVFFVPVAQPPQASTTAPVKKAAVDDPDNSLLELVMEECFDAPESSSTPQDDVDDVLKKVVYLLPEFAWRPGGPVAGELPRKRMTRPHHIAPSRRVLSPPPKMLT